MTFGKMDYLLRLQTLLVLYISNGTVKTKLAILAFFCCEEVMKNSSVTGRERLIRTRLI